MEHTPGPWTYREHLNDTFTILGRNLDAGKTGVPYSGEELTVVFELEDEADARLIAAAPELLEACEDALGIIGAAIGVVPNFQNDLTLAAQTKLLATIAKATGI